MTQVLKYDEACRAVAAARTFDEVREWEDKSSAVREYTRRIRNRSLEIDALEIRERARRRRGELILELKRSGQLKEGAPPVTVNGHVQLEPITLDKLGVSRNESSRDQKIANIDGDSFERLVARCRSYMEENPDKHAVDVLCVKDGPIKGARSIMGSRVEPDDSLDYFPTPPWATRALVESVLRHLGITNLDSTFDPACGEGHIAEVLCEYVKPEYVFASDIFAYGYGKSGSKYDYLNPLNIMSGPDWIITNPPFGDKTEMFVLRAIKEACVGVAMFVRLQWLESIGRYENIFRDYPPTLIAFFAERVNLCKGRWDPDGTTATAYIWLVWIKGAKPRAPFWIPPGRREALTLPDDAEHFTMQPVTKRGRLLPPHDPETGEIAEAAE